MIAEGRLLGRMKIRALALLVVVCTLGGCINGPNSKYEEFGDRVNTEGFGHKFPQPENEEELVLGPADTVDIQIADNPTLSGAQPITFEGAITAPFVGSVRVAGLTPDQIRDKLQILLTPYIRDVSIQVVPVLIQSKVVYIYAYDRFGSLRGRAMPLQGDMTLLDLITRIGGVNFLADEYHIQVIRGDPRHPKKLDINIRDMIENGYTAANIRMRPDDLVLVPQNFFALISSNITRITLPLQSIQRASQTIFFLRNGGLFGGGGNRNNVFIGAGGGGGF